MRELIIGGQRSGKSARAELLASQWLAQSLEHRAVFVATAQAHDAEMTQRIARHRADRAVRLPSMVTVEEPVQLAEAIAQHSAPHTMVVVDCLTLWLTNLLFPYDAAPLPAEAAASRVDVNSEENRQFSDVDIEYLAMFIGAVKSAQGPLVIVSNEIGLGVIPMGRQVRAYVDALGRLNQDVAQVCDSVTFMAAGLPLVLKQPLAQPLKQSLGAQDAG
jgi:adenosylcobinamide kinase / adenosylcobinamide-phosphate guanylyltransferase